MHNFSYLKGNGEINVVESEKRKKHYQCYYKLSRADMKCFSFSFVAGYDFFCIFARVKPKYRYEQDF